MKCLRCGNEVDENCKVCEKCGFEVSTQKTYKKVYIEQDPDLELKDKIKYITYPLLTFIFGLLAMLVSIMIAFTKPISILCIILFAVFFLISFFFSTRKSLVNYKPVREFGIILSYISFFFAILAIMYNILL